MMPPMPRTTLRDLADRVIPGGIDTWLQAERDRRASYADIVVKLREDHDIKVSTELVRQWCRGKAA